MELVEHKKDYPLLLTNHISPIDHYVEFQHTLIPNLPPIVFGLQFIIAKNMNHNLFEHFMDIVIDVFQSPREFWEIWLVSLKDNYYTIIKKGGETEFNFTSTHTKVPKGAWEQPKPFRGSVPETLHPDSPEKVFRDKNPSFKKEQELLNQIRLKTFKIIPSNEDKE
jgi:hypothetical protein